MTKVCTKCGEEKPLTEEYFYKRKDSKDGFRNDCIGCKMEHNKRFGKQYREKNKEAILKSQRKWRENNKESIAEQGKLYRERNKEKISDWHKQNYVVNGEKIRAIDKKYREVNKDKISKKNKQYREENKDKIIIKTKRYYMKNKEKEKERKKEWLKSNMHLNRQNCQNYRARKKQLPNTLTIKQWENIKNDFNNSCAYCGMTEAEHFKLYDEQLHQEHFIPLTNGGEYTHNNIIPACRGCNSSKRDKNFFEWYPTYEHYNKQKETFILEYLGYTNDTQQLSIL